MIINGNRVRELRTERGLTQQKLGQMIGLPKQAISLVECNRQNLELRNFVSLCNVFKVSADELLNRTQVAEHA